MDNDFAIDIDAIFEVVDKADVITIRFLILPQRLLIDTRCSKSEGPLIKAVPRATSLEERFKSIKQLRPRFRLPEKITAIWWPKHVRASAGFPQADEQCQEILEELIRQEQQEILNAIAGKGYHCVWERTR
ncbi:MAG: hypothetical protein AMJ38_05340 [Dehalococcoidia bacterium DG_22]|nr:MAG: hypothetical protein AMJ38_05340 [Dehalococcoidia bacterium DG_22]